MAGGKDEAVAIEPLGIVGIVDEGVAEKHGADFGRTERQAEVAGRAFMDGIDGQATGLSAGFREDFCFEFHEERDERCRPSRGMRSRDRKLRD